MECKVSYQKIPLQWLLILLVFIPFENQAQSVKRETISGYCTSGAMNSSLLKQTAGQPYNTSGSYESNIIVLPGFQQALFFRAVKNKPELLKSSKLDVYPNPAAASVIIQSSEPFENSIIRITDSNGRLIMRDNVFQLQTYTINCSAWSNGIYIITVSDGNKNLSTHKLIIHK